MRDFYTAALNAGGRPNGAPASRGEDNSLFNAAVLDLDGNSIEVIHREGADVDDAKSHFSGHSRVLTWRQGVDDSGTVINDAATTLSVPKSNGNLLSSASSVISSITKASKAPTSVSKALTSVSRAPTSVSKAPTAVSRAPSTARSISTPILPTQSDNPKSSSGITTKGLIGTLLGAAAGAAVAYAMVQSERDSARQELEFEADMTIRARAAPSSQKGTSNRASPISEKGTTIRRPSPQPSRRNFSTTESEAPASLAHRNFSVTESAYSTPRRARTQLALDRAPEPQPLEEADAGTYYSPTYVSLAPSQGPPRSALSRRDQGPISEPPVSEAPSSSVVYATISYNRRPAFSGRSITAPVGPRDEPPSPRQAEDVASQARQAEEQWAAEDMVVARRDSAMSMSGASERSHKSRHSSHRDPSKSRSSHHSERSSRHSDVSKSRRRRDSSRSTHRSHRHRDDSPSKESQTSTIKPNRTHSAAEVPLPSSRKTSVISARDIELPSSRKTSLVSARDVELPTSRKTSLISARTVDIPASKMASVVSARDVELPSSRKTSLAPSMTSTAKIPIPESRSGSLVGSILGRSNRYHTPDSPAPSAAHIALPVDDDDDDDDVFLRAPDTETVLPSDSISCVGIPAADYEDEEEERNSRRNRDRSRSRESRKSKHGSHSHSHGKHRSRHGSETGSTSTVKPAKRSVASLPARRRESDGGSRKRSVVSAAVFGR